MVSKEEREEGKREGREGEREEGRVIRLKNEIICLW